jgi:hypothetical protein
MLIEKIQEIDERGNVLEPEAQTTNLLGGTVSPY